MSRICTRIYSLIYVFSLFLFSVSDDMDPNSVLENSLSAKEKVISELNTELHNMETTLSDEREQYMKEIKKLSALLNEKVRYFYILNITFVC